MSTSLPPINSPAFSDCLRLIFKQLPLTEQLHLRSVHSHWCLLINEHFLSVHSLKLYGSRGDLEEVLSGFKHFKLNDDTAALYTMEMVYMKRMVNNFHYDEFLVKNEYGLVKRACEVIPRLFPNVKFLVVHCKHLFSDDGLSELLTHWSSNLTGILIFRIPPTVSSTFWSALSTMSALKRLLLVRTYKNQIPHPLAILPKLKHFFLTHYLFDLVPILEQLHSVENMKLAMVILSLAQLERAVELNQKLLLNLKWLQLGIISSPPNVNRYTNFKQILNLFCTKFKNIIFIDILMADQLPLTEVIPILAQLPALTDLWLYIGRHQLDANLRNLYSLPKLPSVTSLYLEIYDLTVDQFCLWIGGLFPNLKKLTVKIDPEFREKERFKERIQIEFKQLEADKFKIIEADC